MISSQRNGNKFGLVFFWFLVYAAPSFGGDNQDLVPGEGRDLIIENCTACHSTKIILKNHMSREQWNETITWMQKKQGLWKLGNAVRGKILDYLAKTQGPLPMQDPNIPNRRSGKMYRFDYLPNPL